jgi:hypothetical protein
MKITHDTYVYITILESLLIILIISGNYKIIFDDSLEPLLMTIFIKITHSRAS